MSNFARLFENMDSFKKAKKELEDSLSLDAIKIGFNLDENFWKIFILLLNNPDALAKLLILTQKYVRERTHRCNLFNYLCHIGFSKMRSCHSNLRMTYLPFLSLFLQPTFR